MCTSIVLAARAGNIEILDYLITKYGVDVSGPFPVAICLNCSPPKWTTFDWRGKDAHREQTSHYPSPDKVPLMIAAVMSGRLEVMEHVATRGASVHIANSVGPRFHSMLCMLVIYLPGNPRFNSISVTLCLKSVKS